MIRVSFDINPDGLASITDSHLAALWHISQANPAPHGDRDAGELARAVGVEIVRRWLVSFKSFFSRNSANFCSASLDTSPR